MFNLLNPDSLKYKTSLLLISFTIFLSIIYFLMMFLIAYVVEDEIMERLLTDEVRYLKQSYTKSEQIPLTRTSNMFLFEKKNNLPTLIWEELDKDPNLREFFTEDERHFHLRVFSFSDNKKYYLLADVSPYLIVTNISFGLFIIMTVPFAITLLLAIFIAYKIGSYSVSPIVKLTKEVKQQKAQNGEFNFSEAPYETGYLASTLQLTLNQLQQTLEREKHFTRDISHELRTPLTIIKNTLSLATNRTLRSEDLENIAQSCLLMENTIDVLFGLARAESLAKTQCDLKASIEEVILDLYQAKMLDNFDIKTEFASEVKVSANPLLLRLLLTNLICNAVHHASSKELHIELNTKKMSFSNEIYQTSTSTEKVTHKGIGQGLVLVQRILEQFKWQHEVKMQSNIFLVDIFHSQ